MLNTASYVLARRAHFQGVDAHTFAAARSAPLPLPALRAALPPRRTHAFAAVAMDGSR
jgi:hypothetical protein